MLSVGGQAVTTFGPFSPALVNAREALDPEQRTRAAALLVAHQVRPAGSLSELVHLAMFICEGSMPVEGRVGHSPFESEFNPLATFVNTNTNVAADDDGDGLD